MKRLLWGLGLACLLLILVATIVIAMVWAGIIVMPGPMPQYFP